MRRSLPEGGRASVIAFAVIAAALGVLALLRRPASPPTPRAPAPDAAQSDEQVFAAYAGSQTCRECHPQAFAAWRSSHHGLAERPLVAQDKTAFDPARTIRHGTQTSEAITVGTVPKLFTAGLEGHQPFIPARVIGEAPLRQFLFPGERGRLQAGELAFDPAKGDWFDIFGDEDRQPGEWGHWTGRGMTWNQMCAGCHNTRLRKNYDQATDTYATTMAEMSVGCEACHGPMRAHVDWQKPRPQPARGDPTIKKTDHARTLSTCGQCHARRGEITGEFVPGDAFHDHFLLTIPDETDTFFPDGQVRDENYEYTSFLSSKMFTAGVGCQDCHDPHSAKVKAQDNALCLRCHGPPLPPAVKIDEATHTFHRPGTPGSRCVDCHMPQTTYMQRHPRRDHGFTIPDPLLTKQHGIPNACNRCHQDKSADWAIEFTDKWHGKRMERPSRARAQTIAKARAGDTNALPALTRLAAEEKSGLWRASATRLLGTLAGNPGVKTSLLERTADSNPLVRAQAAQALAPFAAAPDSDAHAAAQKLLSDDTRAVRIAAAWTLHATLDTNSPAGRELLASLRINADQPAGAAQLGSLFLDRGDAATALPWFEKAVAWDGHSAPLRDALAVCYSALGRTADCVRELEAACQIVPGDAHCRHRLGLALSEAGQLPRAVAALEEAVKLEPQLGPAWYNLGLGYSQLERPEDALTALTRAETIETGLPRAAYARATILARLGRHEEARRAAARALEIQRDFPEAQQLLRLLQQGGK